MIKGLSLAKFLPVPTDSTRSLNALSCPPFISEFRRPLSLTPHPLSSGGGLHDLLISDTERASSPCTSNPPFEWWSRNPTVSTIRPNHHRSMGRSAPKPAPDPSPSHRTACRIGVLGALDGFSMGAAYDAHFDTGGAPRCPRRWLHRWYGLVAAARQQEPPDLWRP